jgi:hypothetical protein
MDIMKEGGERAGGVGEQPSSLGKRNSTTKAREYLLKKQLEKEFALGYDTGFNDGYRAGVEDSWSKCYNEGFAEGVRAITISLDDKRWQVLWKLANISGQTVEEFSK